MNRYPLPPIFRQLLAEGCLQEADIMHTRDGFYLAYRSISNLLAKKSVLDFPDAEGRRLACDRFFDDWFLYAVPEGNDYIYSLLKLREQEFDIDQDAPADGDTPGVTICFISFTWQILMDCLCDPSDENRKKLNAEINRVVARSGQRHHRALKSYFINPESEGAYLVAALYPRHIASFAENGCLAVPVRYREIVKQYGCRENSRRLARLPRFIESLNQEAGRLVCDNEKIFIMDLKEPDRFECAAILATHTGNTSVYSFAAEVEYHARYLTAPARLPIPLIGTAVYESAIRADMSVGDAECQGTMPFYRPDSRIVRRQYECHKNNDTTYARNKKGALL